MKLNPDQSASTPDLRRRAEARLEGARAADGGRKPEDGGQRPPDETARLIDELEVHQIELELQNEELMASRAAVETGLARYADLYDFAPTGYLTLDCAGTIRLVNLTGARLLGLERAQLVKRRFGPFVVEGDRPVFNDFLAKVFATENSESCEVMLARAGLPPVVVRIEATRSADGQECRVSLLNITAGKQAEAALKKQHSLLDTVINSPSDIVIFSLDRNYCYTAFNEKHRREMRTIWQAEIKAGTNLLDSMTDHRLRELARQSIDRALGGEAFTETQHQPGPDIYYEFVWNPIRQPDGPIAGVAVFIRDITERTKAESKLAAHIAELRRWHQATLGREHRVLEVKKEVNALLARLGEPPRYASVVEEREAGGSEPVSQ